MEAEEKLIRNRVQIQRRNSFFAYLSLYLKFHKVAEDDVRLKNSLGAGVNMNGDFIYKESFINKMSDDELQGILIHEILHLSLLHLLRGKSLIENQNDLLKFNVACDIVVNQLIKDNSFKLPKGVLMPNYQNKIRLGDKINFLEICDTHKKTAEEIYHEIKDFAKKNKQNSGSAKEQQQEEGDGKDYTFGEGEGRLDAHITDSNRGDGKDKDGKGIGEQERREIEKEWIDRTQQALAVSKMKGDTPKGMERFIEGLHKGEINWKTFLSRYIQSYIPVDYCYSYPSKKSISSGVYMPSTTKEIIDIVIAIDTSGSIGEKELIDFVSEIISLGKAYRGKIKMTLISCDCEINAVYRVENGDVEKIKKEVKIKGGGGTAFKPVIDWIEKNKRDARLLIYLTDGYGEKIDKPKFDIIWVLSKGGSDELLKDVGRVIKLKG